MTQRHARIHRIHTHHRIRRTSSSRTHPRSACAAAAAAPRSLAVARQPSLGANFASPCPPAPSANADASSLSRTRFLSTAYPVAQAQSDFHGAAICTIAPPPHARHISAGYQILDLVRRHRPGLTAAHLRLPLEEQTVARPWPRPIRGVSSPQVLPFRPRPAGSTHAPFSPAPRRIQPTSLGERHDLGVLVLGLSRSLSGAGADSRGAPHPGS
ncbi:hypothetical protein DFH09DRAFT_371639 [Mycena vulgaris]|nr:hypothetical protein DFH09DRAFT_371639 [Mycena vulgaris]